MPRNSADYAEDFYAWPLEQARLLRSGEFSSIDAARAKLRRTKPACLRVNFPTNVRLRRTRCCRVRFYRSADLVRRAV